MATADTLNQLLECELSALETYQRAFKKLKEAAGIDELYAIEEEHWGSANLLRQRIRKLGASPVATSGVWGAWPLGVEGTSRVVGEVADLEALKQEEAHSLRMYREVLTTASLDAESKEMIADVLLPRSERHLSMVEGIEKRCVASY